MEQKPVVVEVPVPPGMGVIGVGVYAFMVPRPNHQGRSGRFFSPLIWETPFAPLAVDHAFDQPVTSTVIHFVPGPQPPTQILEALWSVEFQSNVGGFGGGVAVFGADKVFGGDSAFYYVGSAKIQEDSLVHADITATHYAGPPLSIFGPAKELHVQLTGRPNTPVMELQGHVVGNPALQIRARLTRRADLP